MQVGRVLASCQAPWQVARLVGKLPANFCNLAVIKITEIGRTKKIQAVGPWGSIIPGRRFTQNIPRTHHQRDLPDQKSSFETMDFHHAPKQAQKVIKTESPGADAVHGVSLETDRSICIERTAVIDRLIPVWDSRSSGWQLAGICGNLSRILTIVQLSVRALIGMIIYPDGGPNFVLINALETTLY